ncbi:uncharacterized protein LOC121522633 [Cheilinus undulatus]|uniref:uncharacterized protein LOC121522633 n=1 Tax=Cheilinus undulatus TaxID=241271 RepID=UPI001BD45F5D|nr:uncharacterized protein LOC121522633 [Cheilinus undulatus]
MMCSAWLNLFYAVHIVPSQRACLIWMKRNIKSVIFTALLFSGTLFLFRSAVQVTSLIISRGFHEINGTWTTYYDDELDHLDAAFFIVIKGYSLVCLCVMMVSSFSTVYYLHTHIRSMSHGSSGFSRQKIQSQIRVSITGISQGVLYLIFDTYNVLETFVNSFSHHIILSAWISFTVTSLYVTGTTVNLGIGQAAFRIRMVNIWKKIKAMFRGGE